MHNLERLTRTPLSKQEQSWLRENGGGGEGIILFTIAHIDPLSASQVLYFYNRRIGRKPWQIGEKSLVKPDSRFLEGMSLLATNTGEREGDGPLFLDLAISGVVLVGLHFNDFRGISPHRFSPYQQPVKGASFYLLDIMKSDRSQTHETERQIIVETTSGGPRLVKVAEDWQRRLKAVRPFRFRNWNEVLDVIAA